MPKIFNFTVNDVDDCDRYRDQNDYQDHTNTIHDEFTTDIKLDTAKIYGITITTGATMISDTVIEFHTIEEEAVRTTKKGQSCITTIVLSTIQHVLPVPIEVLLNKKFDQIPCTT